MPEEYVVEVKLENEESLADLTRAFNEVNAELNRLNASLTRFQKAVTAQSSELQKSVKQSAQLASSSRQVTREVENQASALTWVKRVFIGVAGAVAAVTVAYRHHERIQSILYKLDQRRYLLALALAKGLTEYGKQHRTVANILTAFGATLSSLIRTTYNYVSGSYGAKAAVTSFGKTVKASAAIVASELRRAPVDWLKLIKGSFAEASKLIKDFLTSTSKSAVETTSILLAGVSKGVATSLKMISNQVLPSVALQFKNALSGAQARFVEVAKSSSVLKAALLSLGTLAKNTGAILVDLGWGLKYTFETGAIVASTVFDIYDVSLKRITNSFKSFSTTMLGVAKTLAAPLAALVTPLVDLPSAISPSFRAAVTRFKQFESATWALARTTYEASRESSSALRSFAAASKVYLTEHLAVVKDTLTTSAKSFKIWLSSLGIGKEKSPYC